MNTLQVILGIENIIGATDDKEVHEVAYELIDKINREGIHNPWD